jgi:hypothetical protein
MARLSTLMTNAVKLADNGVGFDSNAAGCITGTRHNLACRWAK